VAKFESDTDIFNSSYRLDCPEAFSEQAARYTPSDIELRPFQLVPAYCQEQFNFPHLLIGDDPGVGKTNAALVELTLQN
jgi:hypothetical protein